MGILDDIKPPQKKHRPISWSHTPELIHVEWDDKKAYAYAARALRLACPCAGCVDEWSGKRTINEAAVPADLRIAGLTESGRYALALAFSDQHATGIYSWDYLRTLMETWTR